MPETIERSKIRGDTWIQAVEPMLKEGNSFLFTPQGMSMFPFLMPERDAVVVAEAHIDQLRRGDIVLYLRPDQSLIVHRIYKRKKNGFYIVGDNETLLEGPVLPEQIKAKALSLRRNGVEISCKDWRYRVLSEVWMWLRPMRPWIVSIRKKIYKKYGY